MPEKPLIAEIVNSKKGGDPRQERVLPVGGVKGSRNECTLPVVMMTSGTKSITFIASRIPLEKRQTLGIVYKITILSAVEIVPVIVLVLVHKMSCDAVGMALDDLALSTSL